MKNYVKIFGIIAVAAIIGFSFAACGDDGGSGGGSLEGSWYSSKWTETFTFTVIDDANGTFTKMKDEGWGEKGTFTYTATTFTTTITEKTDDGSTWTPWESKPDQTTPTEQRNYIIDGNTLLLNGEHTYVKN